MAFSFQPGGLFRSDDHGKSWELVRGLWGRPERADWFGAWAEHEVPKGLPQEHCYDLIFRHALDVDETGDRLAIGSTTDGLWLSEDQNNSWQAVSTHLPPVHAVKFA